MTHKRCYWCSGLVDESDAETAKLSGTTVFWHKKCALVDPLCPIHKEYRPPVFDFNKANYGLDE